MSDKLSELVPAPRVGASVDSRLGAEEKMLLSLIDGQTALGELADWMGSAVDRLVRPLQQLVARNMVECPDLGKVLGAEARARGSEQGPGAASPEDEAKLSAVEGRLDALVDMSPHECLGLGPTPSIKEIRKAYFAWSKAYHPDCFFGRDIGRFRAKLDRAFDIVTRAHDVLRAEARERKRQARQVPEETGIHPIVEPAAAEAARPEVTESSAPSSPESAPRDDDATTTLSPQQVARARQRVAQRLRRQLKTHRELAPERTPEPAPPEATPEPEVEASPRPASQGSTSRVHKLGNLVREAGAAEADGRMGEAANLLCIADAISGGEHVQGKLRRVRSAVWDERSRELLHRARRASGLGDWKMAVRTWNEILRYMPDDPSTLFQAAQANLELGDHRRAGALAKRAVKLDPEQVKYHTLLVKVFEAAGLSKSADQARRELKRLQKAAS